MQNYIDATDRFGNKKRNYFITQGDTFYTQLVLKTNGVPITPSDDLIRKILFKIATPNMKEELAVEMIWDTEREKYCLEITSEQTNQLKIGEHVYEIEVTWRDFDISTVTSAYFVVTPEIEEV